METREIGNPERKKRLDVSCHQITPPESFSASVRGDVFRLLVPGNLRGRVRKYIFDKFGRKGLRFLGYEPD
ncbi:hypothetical protein K9L63_00155 [Candidatus Gracilibacteria bacterium]|nr:hypothetical protein [Candidatus Gracilibacteria bacterium]